MLILAPTKEIPKANRARTLIERLYGSPSWLIVTIIVSLFVVESVVMALLSYFPDLDPRVALLLDSTLLILVILPCLNLFVFRPLALHLKERQRAEDALQMEHGKLFESRERLRSLSAHLQAAREEERASIAREIHDELGQVLATLQLHVSLACDAGRDGCVPADRVAPMAGLIEGAIGAVQRMCSQQRPVMLDDLGLAAALEWQAREFEKRSAIPCEIAVSLKDEGRELDARVAIALFRIFQEALTNVLRHAGATRIEASLVEKRRSIELVIRDNGRGITREESLKSGSFGLLGMRERAGMLGGKVRVVGSPRVGTAVLARIPLRPGKGENHDQEADTDSR